MGQQQFVVNMPKVVVNIFVRKGFQKVDEPPKGPINRNKPLTETLCNWLYET